MCKDWLGFVSDIIKNESEETEFSVGHMQNVACNDRAVKNKFTKHILVFALANLTSSGEYHKFSNTPPYGEEHDLQAIDEDCK